MLAEFPRTVGLTYVRQYTLVKLLGKGSYGKVYLTQDQKAVKEIQVSKDSRNSSNQKIRYLLDIQIQCLKSVNNQNVIKMYDYFHQGGNIYCVMQCCQTDLHKRIKNEHIDQKKAYQYLIQIINGYQQLVDKNIVHRDLKPQNILIHQNTLKIADFGLSKIIPSQNSLLYTVVGSPVYSSPEVLEELPYTRKCDIWSIGIIFYQLLAGTYPWSGFNCYDLLKNIKTKPLILNCLKIKDCTKQLLKAMLNVDKNLRIDWKQLKQKLQNIISTSGFVNLPNIKFIPNPSVKQNKKSTKKIQNQPKISIQKPRTSSLNKIIPNPNPNQKTLQNSRLIQNIIQNQNLSSIMKKWIQKKKKKQMQKINNKDINNINNNRPNSLEKTMNNQFRSQPYSIQKNIPFNNQQNTIKNNMNNYKTNQPTDYDFNTKNDRNRYFNTPPSPQDSTNFPNEVNIIYNPKTIPSKNMTRQRSQSISKMGEQAPQQFRYIQDMYPVKNFNNQKRY